MFPLGVILVPQERGSWKLLETASMRIKQDAGAQSHDLLESPKQFGPTLMGVDCVSLLPQPISRCEYEDSVTRIVVATRSVAEQVHKDNVPVELFSESLCADANWLEFGSSSCVFGSKPVCDVQPTLGNLRIRIVPASRLDRRAVVGVLAVVCRLGCVARRHRASGWCKPPGPTTTSFLGTHKDWRCARFFEPWARPWATMCFHAGNVPIWGVLYFTKKHPWVIQGSRQQRMMKALECKKKIHRTRWGTRSLLVGQIVRCVQWPTNGSKRSKTEIRMPGSVGETSLWEGTTRSE